MAGLILPWCNIEAMGLHLAAISAKVAPGRHAALLLDQGAGASLGATLFCNRPGHGRSPRPRRQKFFACISFSVETSGIDSASSFFSRAFSPSSPFNLRASDTSMPPYFDRHV